MARTSIPEKPLGYTKGSFLRLKIWEFLFGGKFPIKGEGGTVVQWDSSSGIYFIKSQPNGGGGGAALKFKLYDPTKACSAGTIYKIRTTDAAAITGVAVSETIFIKAMPGKFYCLKDVPANPTEAKHIPQLPDGSGQTDPEHADKHWEFITPAIICTPDGSVEI